jgi:hypothetical protein
MTVVSRRTILTLASLLSSSACLGDATIGSAQDGTIGLIAELGDLLAKAAEAVSKFGDSIAHLVTLGAQAYDAAAARKAHAELIELRVNLEKLVAGANIPLIKSINEYVERVRAPLRPPPYVLGQWWIGVVDKVANATKQVDALLKDVDKIRNDFVAQDAYSTLQFALNGRRSILAELRALPAPVEQDELQALAKAGDEYQKLSDATLKASQQLATYISSVK